VKRREVAVAREWMKHNWRGWWYKIPDAGLSKKPFDIVACDEKGKFWAIEFKRKDGRLLPHQEENLKEVAKWGGRAMIVWWWKDRKTKKYNFKVELLK